MRTSQLNAVSLLFAPSDLEVNFAINAENKVRTYYSPVLCPSDCYEIDIALHASEEQKKLNLERDMRPGSAWRRRRDLNPRASHPTYSLSRGAPSPLGYFSVWIFNFAIEKCWRRGRDSNPWLCEESLVFKTSSLNRSDTSPIRRRTL